MNGTSRTATYLAHLVTLDDRDEWWKMRINYQLKNHYWHPMKVAWCIPIILIVWYNHCGEVLDSYAVYEVARKVLTGEVYQLRGVDDAAVEVLKYLKLKEGTTSEYATTLILTMDYKTVWEKANERSASVTH